MASSEIMSEITTKSTGSDGVRDSAWSGWDVNSTPDDHVINRDTVSVVWHSDAGSENMYELIIYDNRVEILPGTQLKFPKTIKVKTYARGFKGHSSGRGWSKSK